VIALTLVAPLFLNAMCFSEDADILLRHSVLPQSCRTQTRLLHFVPLDKAYAPVCCRAKGYASGLLLVDWSPSVGMKEKSPAVQCINGRSARRTVSCGTEFEIALIHRGTHSCSHCAST
jgi:hypothetical protein